MDDHAARIRELEQRVQDAAISNASLTASVNHLTTTVEALNETVRGLNDVMNQGRGALWLGMLLVGTLSATIALVFKRLMLGVPP